MTKFLKNIWSNIFSFSQKEPIKHDRKDLERKVEEGTERAIKDYRRAFEKLAEYDRT